MIQLLGAALLVAGCGGLGMAAVSRLDGRVRDLRELSAGLEILQRELNGQELEDRFLLEGTYLCQEDIGEEKEILIGEEIPGLEPPPGTERQEE